MRNIALGMIAVTLSGAFALAEDRAPLERASVAPTESASVLHEFSREMLECSVYYRIAVQCFEDYPDPRAPKVASEYGAAVDQLTAVALGIARSIGQSDAAFRSFTAMIMKDQMAAIKQSCANISMLQQRYAAFCQDLARSPNDRFRELLAGKTCTGEYRCQ
jgi:hypothetical protein